MGIGTHLAELMKDRYRNFLRIVLVARGKNVGFCESCGSQKPDRYSPVSITDLWT